MVKMIGRRSGSSSQSSTMLLQEKQVKPRRNKMTSSNINSYVLKSYLNVFKWVADRMQGCSVSNANIDFAFVVF